MRAREALLESDLLPGDLERIFPICTPDASDSASFDEVLELLHLGGRSLPHAVLMMIPEAWENHDSMSAEKRAFYRFHASLMEPWDGPASIAFTDGTVIGRGARPQRAASVAVLGDRGRARDHGERGRRARRPAGPGRAARVGSSRAACSSWTRPQGRIVDDEEIKRGLAAEQPYGQWLDDGLIQLDELPPRTVLTPVHSSHVRAAAPVRLDRGGAAAPRRADGAHRCRADRVDGHRHADRRALGSAPPALRLLPAALRAGHEPAARRHPRGARHEPRRHDRARGEPARARAGVVSPDRAAAPGHRQRGPREAPLHRRGGRGRRLQARDDRRALPGPRWRRRPSTRDREGAPPGERRDRRRRRTS